MGEDRVERQLDTAGRALLFFFHGVFHRQLSVDKEENHDKRKNGERFWTPEFSRFAHREVRKKDTNERGDQGDESLIAKLWDLAEQAVFEKNEAEDCPPDGDAERFQFVPQHECDECGRRPGIDVVEIVVAPLLWHSNEARERVE